MNSSKEVIRLIKNIRTSKKVSLDALSKKVGMAKSTLSRYESGERDFPINDVGKFADALGTSVEYLLGLNNYKKTKEVEYNFIPTAISAGLPINVDGITTSEAITLSDSVMGKWAGNKDILISSIYGDSMDKIMPDGSLIAIKPITLEELKNGDIVVFSANGEYSIKYYFKHGDKLVFKPHSHNNDFYDQIYSVDDNITIHGKVVVYIVEMD